MLTLDVPIWLQFVFLVVGIVCNLFGAYVGQRWYMATRRRDNEIEGIKKVLRRHNDHLIRAGILTPPNGH